MSKGAGEQRLTRPRSPFRGGIAGSSDLLDYVRSLERYCDALERRDLDESSEPLPLLRLIENETKEKHRDTSS